MKAIRTTCPYCGVGCGVSASVGDGRRITIKGDADHPANAGRLCSKGTHLAETVGLEGRLLHPMMDGNRASWDAALSAVARRFAETIREHGPDSVAFYVSGQLLTEDYYIANKLMKGFIGSANIDTNSRLCMASAVAAHNRAFGEDIVPCSYADLEEADLILLVGSNTAWCHPVIWQRIEAARAVRGTKLVVIDPRRTETAEQADLHVAVAPDGDVALFNALLSNMARRGLIDHDYLDAHVDVPEQFWLHLSDDAGIDNFEALADLVAAHPKMVTLFSQGANQSVGGTDKGNAIINLHLATGRIGKAGVGPFSITGQPNAMGGREVGGLANTLAVHRGFTDADCAAVQEFWSSPTIARKPGLKAVDLFRAVHDGRVKALWVMATNPAVSMPDAGFVREALAKCEFLVVSDMFADTDTAKHAHVLLPALGWGEKDGTVTNSERVLSRQRALFPPPDEARADWAIIADVARRMGFGGAFDYPNAASIFREYAAQTAFRNEGARVLNISEFGAISDGDYDSMQPVQWGGTSPFAEGQYSHPNRRARMIAVQPLAPKAIDPAFPLRLNTGRYRDQWHTMTRTGLSATLSQHRREPLLEIHPDDAALRGVEDGGLANVITQSGRSLFRVSVTNAQQRGAIFVPMHWTDSLSNNGRANRLPNQSVDPVSGQPGFKDNAAEVVAVTPEWRAFLVTRDAPNVPANTLYHCQSRVAGGWLTELAGMNTVDVDAMLPCGERMEAMDMRRGMRRVAVRDRDSRLSAALFLTRSGKLPPRDWIAAQLQGGSDDALQWLAARPKVAGPDKGPIVCVCFNVGVKQICAAIADQNLTSVEGVSAALNAGTNCGSCRPAIARLLAETMEKVTA